MFVDLNICSVLYIIKTKMIIIKVYIGKVIILMEKKKELCVRFTIYTNFNLTKKVFEL